MTKRRILIGLMLLTTLFVAGAQFPTFVNPVLEGVADVGVMKHNGLYYIGGVHTEGDFFYSSDLVHWSEPVHVVDMDNEWTRATGAGNDQIHSNDMTYHNGLFHLYWSVNYWGTDRHVVHIAHAVSESPTGPYYEPAKRHWLESRIDPKLFRDDDGQLYMYYVKFTYGNCIWVRPMSDPATFSGDSHLLIASLPGSWETLDNRVAEAPWVLKYRGRYYLVYNANHTAPSYGNYMMGVAESDSPIGFNEGNKYSAPLLFSNEFAIENEGKPVGEKLFTPGQPNVVRGPNGFEWWMVYMANIDHRERSQHIDRVHFYDTEMKMSGITGTKPVGYSPAPAKPTVGQIEPFELTDPLPEMPSASSYLIESGLRTDGHATFILPLSEDGAAVQVGFNKADNSWHYTEVRSDGKEISHSEPLYDGFRWDVYHHMRVEKDQDLLSVWLDDMQVLHKQPLRDAQIGGKFSPSLSASEGTTFAGFCYTIGFDARDIKLQPHSTQRVGDPLSQYELTFRLNAQGATTIYPCYQDPQNHVALRFNERGELMASVVNEGETTLRTSVSLDYVERLFPDSKYTDFIEHHFQLPAPTLIDWLEVSTRDADDPELVEGDMWSHFTLEYLLDGQWHPIDRYRIKESARAEGYQRLIPPEPILVEAIRATNAEPTDTRRHIYTIVAHKLFSPQKDIRLVRDRGELYLYHDQKEALQLSLEHETGSEVLIESDDTPIQLQQVLYYHLNY
ncbi:MAG: family 43 glycosylhydrolase [Porphyromonas sp.]|nr:family 43 glycosylhydrolase [Porphyromonas sp.]